MKVMNAKPDSLLWQIPGLEGDTNQEDLIRGKNLYVGNNL
jgi:hypothetical protein